MAKRGRKQGITVGKYKSRADSEIQHLQSTTHLLLARGPFARVVQDVVANLEDRHKLRMEASALAVLQHTAEQFVVEIFIEANVYATHAKRTTVAASESERLRCDWLPQPLALASGPNHRRPPKGARGGPRIATAAAA